jgi:predicted nucleotidyltransferase
MNQHEILRTLHALRSDLEERYKVEEISLFGSFVRGQQTEMSDVDVLVEFAPDATFFDLVRLANFLEETLHRHVDVIPKESLRPEIREVVLRERVLV